MNKKRLFGGFIFGILFVMLSCFYFSYPLMVMPDSAEYYGYLEIFYGRAPLSTWNIVRGPSFPFILFVFSLIFGNSERGILIGTFVMFLIMIISGYRIIRKLNYRNNLQRDICYFLYCLLVVFNPLLIGYSHGLLTEFAAGPLCVVFCILSYKWINCGNKIWKNVVLSTVLVLGSVFMWFLKQPYVFLCVAAILGAALVSSAKKKTFKNIAYRFGIFFISIIAIVVSINIWNLILNSNKADTGTGKDSESYIRPAIINGNTRFQIDPDISHYERDYILNSPLIEDKDKSEIIKIMDNKSKYKSFKLINIYKDYSSRDDANTDGKMVMYSKESKYTTMDALKMYLKIITKYPAKTMNSYYMNYLAMVNILPSYVDRSKSNVYYPGVNEGFYYENKEIGYSMYYSKNNLLWLDEEHHSYNDVKNLKTDNNSPVWLNELIKKKFNFYNGIFKVVMVIAPIFLLYVISKCIQLHRKKKSNANIELAMILLFTSFVHLVFHSVTGAIIDRYAIPVFTTIILGVLIILFESRKEKRTINEKNTDMNKEEPKVLIVVPAYNEEKNIRKTVLDITKNTNYDYIIVNDCSKDKTKKVCEDSDFNIISLPINYGLTSGIQIGMKYAKSKDYDIVIQFDGDGQHQAKYLTKMVEYMCKKNLDVVIGSRFVNKKKSFSTRMIGSRVLTFIIKIVTGETIKDPTSGMRAYNKRAINEFYNSASFTPEPDTIVYMINAGYKVGEIQVEMKEREFGESYLNPIRSLKYMVNMIMSILFIKST